MVRRCLAIAVGTLVLIGGLARLSAAADEGTDDARARKLADRYWQIVARQPRPGTALDALYRLYLDGGRLDALEQRARQHADQSPQDEKAQMLWGLVAERRGRYDDSEAAFRRAEQLGTSHYASVALGNQLARRRKFDQAASAFERALRRKPPRNELLEIVNQLGRVQLRRGLLDRALAAWSQLAKDFPGDVQVLVEIAEILTEQRQPVAALERWQQVVTAAKDQPYQRLQAELHVARLHAQLGHQDQSTAVLGKLLDRLAPQSWEAESVRETIRTVFLDRDNLKGLAAFWRKRYEAQPDDLASRLQLARALSRLGESTQALVHLREAVKQAPTRRDVRELLIDELSRARKWDEAVTAGEALAKRFPRDVEVLQRLGDLHLQRARTADEPNFDAALAAWKRLAEVRGDDPALAVRVAENCRRAAGMTIADSAPVAGGTNKPVGRPLSETGDALIATAERYYREATRRAPGRPEYWEYLGEFYHQLDRKQGALEAWSHMTAGDQNTAEQWSRLAQVQISFGYLPAALQSARRATDLAPRDFALREQFTRLLLRAQKFEQAVGQLDQLHDLAGDNAQRDRALRQQLNVYEAAGIVDQEILRLRKKIDAGGSQARDYWLLALLLERRYHYTDAIASYREALKLAPNDIRLLRDFAHLLEQQGELLEASGQYRRLVELDLRNRAAHYTTLIHIALHQDQTAEARKLADELVRLSPSSLEAHQIQADVAFRLGDIAGGLAAMGRAVRLAPRDLELRMRYARQLATYHKSEEARDHYWRCFELASDLTTRLSVIQPLADIYRESGGLDALHAALERLGRKLGDDRDVTFCRVALLEQREQHDSARQLLTELVARNPGDIDALRQIAEKLRAGGNVADAVAYQERLVKLLPTENTLAVLATDYGRLGRRDDAIGVWRRILASSDDHAALIRAIDQQLETAAYDQAQVLANWGLERQADDWRLLFRAGYSEFLLGNLDEAERHFQRLLELPPEKNQAPVSITSAGTGAPAQFPMAAADSARNHLNLPGIARLQLNGNLAREFQELQRATIGFSRFLLAVRATNNPALLTYPGITPAVVRETRENMLKTQAGQRKMLAAIGLPQRLDQAQTEAVLGTYVLAMRRKTVATWINRHYDEKSPQPRSLRNAVLALSVATIQKGQLDSLLDAVEALIERLPDDALPRIALITADAARHPAGFDGSATRSRWTKALHASMRWVRDHRPNTLPSVADNYAQLLLAFNDVDGATDFVTTELARAERFEALHPLASLAYRLADRSAQRRLVARAAEFAEQLKSPPPARWNLELLLTHITASGARFDDVTELDHAQTLLIHWFQQQAAAASGRSSPRMAANLQFSRQLNTLRRQLFAREQILMEAYQRRLNAGNLSAAEAREAQRAVERELRRLNAQRRALTLRFTPGLTANAPRKFPSATRSLEENHLLVLEGMYDQLHTHNRSERLIKRIREQVEASPAQVASRFQMAAVCLLWWSNKRREALAALDELCRRDPRDDLARFMLARGYFELRQMKEALKALQVLKTNDASLARGATELRREITNRWSTQALVHVLRGHDGVVRAAAISPDGKKVATASVDRTVKIWNAQDGSLIRTLDQHTDMVLCVAFAPDGRTLASGGYDQTIRVWDARTGELRRTLKGHNDIVRCLAFSPDGKQLASGGDDHRVRLWHAATGEPLDTLHGHDKVVYGLAYSPDGRSLASAGDDRRVILWSLQQPVGKRQAKSLTGHREAVTSVAFTHDNRQLVSADWAGHLRVWDAATGEVKREFNVAGDVTVRAISVRPDSNEIALACDDKTVKILEVPTGTIVNVLRGHAGIVQSVSYSKDGRRIVSAGYDTLANLWHAEVEPPPQ